MQTFLPIASIDFYKSAEVLDNKRLNKQALEGWQILMTLLELDPEGNFRKPKGWVNHPAVKMWRGHEVMLFNYVQCMVREWKQRGFKSTIGDKASNTLITAFENDLLPDIGTVPKWMLDKKSFEAIAQTHRQALLVKDYTWYKQFHWAEDNGVAPTDYTYIWSEDEINE